MSRALWVFCVAISLARGAAAQGQAADTLRLATVLQVARDSNPMLRAALLSAEAAAHRVGPAGALPDPQVQLGLMNRMASDFGNTMDPMTMNQVQLMQMLPWPGKLGGAKRAASHTAAAATADADEQARALAVQVRTAYYDLAATDRAIVAMRGTRELLRQFQDVSTTLYAVGSAVQQDVLRAQVEVARMTEDITRMEQERVASATRLNALLGRAPQSDIGPLELPEPAGALPSADTLVAWALSGRPALLAGTERVAAADASLGAARRGLYPDFEIGVQYQSRPMYPNMMSVMLGVNLPIFAGSKQLAMRREMAAMRDMAQADLVTLRNETTARVIETRARVARDRNLALLYRTSILPQARAAVQTSAASYRVGRVSFMQLIENQMTVNRYETESYRLSADFLAALGELEALVGRPLVGEVAP